MHLASLSDGVSFADDLIREVESQTGKSCSLRFFTFVVNDSVFLDMFSNSLLLTASVKSDGSVWIGCDHDYDRGTTVIGLNLKDARPDWIRDAVRRLFAEVEAARKGFSRDSG